MRYSTAVNVVNQLQAAQSDGTFLRRLKTYLSPDVLYLDELGYLPIDRHGADLLFQVITGRYERGSVILTTNRPFKEWASVFNDATVADAVINRLAHHSEVVVIEGVSYRLRKRKNGKKKTGGDDDQEGATSTGASRP